MFAGEDHTREEYLRAVFGERWTFEHYGTTIHYVPSDVKLGSEYILGRIGRAVKSVENAPPEAGFQETMREGWKAAVVAVDPRDMVDGQKIAIQLERQLGKPLSLIRSFLNHVNGTWTTTAYTIEVQPIFNAETFWQFAEENKGEVVSITFDFVVPNGLWTASTSLRDELRAARETINAQEVSTTIKSPTGLDTDSKQIREAVAYTETGSGAVRAKTRHGKTYSSATRAKQTRVPINVQEDKRDRLERAEANLAKILGHE